MSDEFRRSTDWDASSTQTKLARRRIKRIVWIVFAVVFVLPTLFTLLAGGVGQTSGLSGLLLTLPLALFSFLFPIVILLLLLTGIGYTIYSYYNPAQIRPPSDEAKHAEAAEAEDSAAARTSSVPASSLATLESLRSETQEEARGRKRMFIPLGAGIAALLFWMMASSGGRWHASPGVILLTMLALGAAGGWFMAVARPGKHYARSFKKTLLPSLLARFGELVHGQGGTIEIARLVETGVLPRYTRAKVDDTITGIYRGYPIEITELTLTRRHGKRSSTEFHGLIIRVAGRRASGFDVVVRDSEVETRIPQQTGRPLQPVLLGDAAFEEIYTVHGSDEPAIRSMLNPAARKALMTMADGKGFHPPLLLYEGSTMTGVVESSDWRDLLEPSNVFAKDAGAQASKLESELADIFALVEGLLALIPPLQERPVHPD